MNLFNEQRIFRYFISGVYEITFIKGKGTAQFYTGLINRKLKTSMKEHITDIKYDKKTTTLAGLTKNLCRLIFKIVK